MANERCPKCGSEMIAVPEGLSFPKEWICPLDPKDCRIKELGLQLRAREADVLALREALDGTSQRCRYYLKHQNFPDSWDDKTEYEKGVEVTCMNLEKIMFEIAVPRRTSATAQEITQKIERRALEMGWERFSALEREQKESGIRYTYKQALAQARAAFLGTNNP